MKKYITILILFFLSLNLSAQIYFEDKKTIPKNTLYLVYQPIDMGIGVRYDRMFTPKWGSYIAFSYGEYRNDKGLLTQSNYKAVSGVLLYFNPLCDIINPYIGVGLNFNGYNMIDNLPANNLYMWSFELSANARISNNWNIGVRCDPIEKVTSLDIGFSF